MGATDKAAGAAGKAAVEVGQVFAKGGTDGLILYALILGTFLMFLVAIAAVWFSHRAHTVKDRQMADALAAKDKLNAEQTAAFIASADRQSDALTRLAEATATQTAVQAAQTGTLARIEGLPAMRVGRAS